MAKFNKQVTDSALWRRIVREVRDQQVANTEVGQISATKMEVITERYKRRGGQFTTPKLKKSRAVSMASRITREIGKQKRTKEKGTDKK